MDHDLNLTIRYEHEEGGIVDLVVGPVPPGPRTGWLKRPIYLQSARGHVVRLEIDAGKMFPTYPSAGLLAGASTLQFGGRRDLDVVPYQGQQHLAGLWVPQFGQADAIRFFALDTCNQVAGFGNIEVSPYQDPPISVMHNPASGDPTFCHVLGASGDRYVIWSGGEISVWDGFHVVGHKWLSTFVPASGQATVAAGEIDPASPGQEVVIATSAGRLVWVKLSELEGSLANTALTLPRTVILDTDNRVYEDRCNTSLAATWAMAAVPASGGTPGKIHAVDSVGTLWEVDPITGNPTRIMDTSGGRSLVPALAPDGFVMTSGGANETAWQMQVLVGTTLLQSSPYVPDLTTLPSDDWYLPQNLHRPAVPLAEIPPQAIQHRYWLFGLGGTSYVDTTVIPHRVWLAWWQNHGAFYDLIQRATYDVPELSQKATIANVRGSTQGVYLNGQPPPRWPTGPTGFKPLRSELGSVGAMNLVGIRIGRVMTGQTDPQIVAAAMGGRVMVLRGTDCTLLTESDDYGLGGMALAVGNLDGDPTNDEIVFAPAYNPMPHAGQKVRSYLHVLSGATGTLTEVGTPVPVGDLGSDDFLGYGACGIAIADVPQHGKLIFVATLNGELAVFRPLANGAIDPNPVFRTVVEGSIGAFGSILIANLVPDFPADPKPELYLAGSSGLRRFDFP